MSRLSFVVAIFGVALLAMPARTEGPDAPDKKPGRAGGYAAAFDAALEKIGPITPAEFARRFADKAKYLERLSWDPTTAQSWKDLSLDPKDFRSKGQRRPLSPTYDFRLDERELAVFKSNGFVVSERMGDSSCAKPFYRIYTRDLPVFISSDAVLHAWHRSYDAMLEELESSYLATSLEQILAKMVEAIPAARAVWRRRTGAKRARCGLLPHRRAVAAGQQADGFRSRPECARRRGAEGLCRAAIADVRAVWPGP